MAAKKLHLLFTSVGRRVELIRMFRRAADILGVRLVITGTDISPTAPALAFCDYGVAVPRISSPDYIPTLVQLCRETQVDGLIPTIDTDLLPLAMEKQRFEDVGTRVFISDPDKIHICRNKCATADYLLSLGLYAPRAVMKVSDYQEGFPAFIKPIDGSSSVGANRADTLEELEMYAKQLGRYMIQPFARGTEYTVDIFCDDRGNPVYITPRIRMAVRAGEVLKTKIHNQENIISEMHTLLKAFKPCGPITVQLIRNNETGVNQYIEINPRFGGGAPLSMQAGADAAVALLRLLMGETLEYCPDAANEGAVFSRFDQSICISRDQERPVRGVIFDLDDTLYSEKDYVRSGYKAIAQALPWIGDAEEKLWSAFEQGQPAIDVVLKEAGCWTEEVKKECLETYRNHQPEIQLYDGVRQLLEELRSQNVKIGIITDGRPEGQRRKLEALGLYDLVDSVMITDELGSERFRKPNDIAFRIMQTRFQIPYDQMLYVGDNPGKDFQAPRTLGMQWLYFCNEDGLYSKAAEGTVTTVAQMREKLIQATM